MITKCYNSLLILNFFEVLKIIFWHFFKDWKGWFWVCWCVRHLSAGSRSYPKRAQHQGGLSTSVLPDLYPKISKNLNFSNFSKIIIFHKFTKKINEILNFLFKDNFYFGSGNTFPSNFLMFSACLQPRLPWINSLYKQTFRPKIQFKIELKSLFSHW